MTWLRKLQSRFRALFGTLWRCSLGGKEIMNNEHPMQFHEAVRGLLAGDFSRLAPLFDGAPCSIIQWHEAGLFADEPQALDKAFTIWRRCGMNETPQGEAPIEIVQYDPLWPSKFETERAVLQTVMVPWLAGTIEHVGSTAIPQMSAKPVIDIMAAVGSLEASRPAISALAETGYVYLPYRADIMHWFCKPSPAYRTHHLHLVPLDSQRWIDCLAFRDAIRSDQTLAAEYASLKKRLAQEFKFDREAYTDGKAPFVERVLRKRKNNAFPP